MVDGLTDTSNWLTSHRIQEVMRVLTIVMALLAPATLLASIYGMNVQLPGGHESLGFLTLGVIIVAIDWHFRRDALLFPP